MPRSRWNWPPAPLSHWPSGKKSSKAAGSKGACCWTCGTLDVSGFSNGSLRSENSPLSLPASIPSRLPFLSVQARTIRWVASGPINGQRQASPASTRQVNVPASVCTAPIGSEAIHSSRRLCSVGAQEFEQENTLEPSRHRHLQQTSSPLNSVASSTCWHRRDRSE